MEKSRDSFKIYFCLFLSWENQTVFMQFITYQVYFSSFLSQVDDMSKNELKSKCQSRGGELEILIQGSLISQLTGQWVGFRDPKSKTFGTQKIGSSCFHNVGFPGPKKWKL